MRTRDEEPALELVVQAVARSKRYRFLCDATVRRLARRALEASRGDVREGVKRTKRHLHQVFGAFLTTQPPYDKLLRRLDDALDQGPEATRQVLSRFLALHASTRERLALLDTFYQRIFAVTGPPASVLDLACGFHPLAAPWMHLPAGTAYWGTEIDGRLVRFLGQCVERLGFEAHFQTADVLSGAALPRTDLTFLLKLLPTLERQRQGSGAEVLSSLPPSVLVVSFPTRSLGRRGKGMEANYERFFEGLAQERGWSWERLSFGGEWVYVVDR